ncbi:helix-turn-helix domain-containing protein [Chlorogloeopsis fritschii PCC 9212]|uniref:helix-turn-helix domain-containing protein n=1 Tax=Chlorogloeopsis fritschii TaxID=1124 RepID=UPI00370DCE22
MKWLRRNHKHESTPSVDNQKQAEKLADIGRQLSASRQENGLSLEEMVVLTKVPRRLLQAIEEGNLKELPEPIYIQGLIRQYADALGFNGTEFASHFPVTINKIITKPVLKTTTIGELRPIHLYLIYVFVILSSVIGLSRLLNPNALQTANKTQQQPDVEAVLDSRATQNAQPNLQSVSEITSSEEQQLQIGVILTEKSWIQVRVDGKVEYEGELPQGFRGNWQAQEQLTVRTDNAGGVLVSVNRQKAKQLGEPGKQKEFTIAANTRS